MSAPSLGCLVMAAGSAVRFGENKLAAYLGGKMLIERIFEAIPKEMFSCLTVVTQYDEIEALAPSYGFHAVRNDRPDLGLSRTVRLGVEAMEDCDAILFCVADQPLLRRESIESEVGLYLANPEHIVALSHSGRRGNPCIFPKTFFPALKALTGDHGGRSVIEQHEDMLLLYEVSAEQLVDVDTPDTLESLKKSV